MSAPPGTEGEIFKTEKHWLWNMAVFSLKQRHHKNCADKIGRGGLISQIFLQEYSPIVFSVWKSCSARNIYLFYKHKGGRRRGGKKMKNKCNACMLSHFSRVWLFGIPSTTAHQTPLSLGFSRQEYWSGLSFPFPGDLPDPGIEPMSPVSASEFFTSSATWEAPVQCIEKL